MKIKQKEESKQQEKVKKMVRITEEELEKCSEEELLKIMTREINENRNEREDFRTVLQRERRYEDKN